MLALLRRLDSASRMGQEFLYFRVDNATNTVIRWAYLIDGTYQIAGPRSRRYGGRPVNP